MSKRPINQFRERSTLSTPTSSILELCRAGDFELARQALQDLGDRAASDPSNFALASAHVDLCACYRLHRQLRDLSNAFEPLTTLRGFEP